MEKKVQEITSNIQVHYVVCPVDFFLDQDLMPHHRVPLYPVAEDEELTEGYFMLMSAN